MVNRNSYCRLGTSDQLIGFVSNPFEIAKLIKQNAYYIWEAGNYYSA